jgi:GGDEF domain-containing protein
MVEGISMPITVSIGLTSHLSDTKINLDQLLQEADKALYISKHGGRDRVTLYEDTALIPPTEG